MQQLLWFRDDFAASSSRSPLLLTRAGLFEQCFLLLWSTAPVLVACRAGVLGAGISPAGRRRVDGTVAAGPRNLAPLSSARTSGLGCWDVHTLMSRLDTV